MLLIEHSLIDHSGYFTFDNFKFDVVSKFSNLVEIRICEARMITTLKPQLKYSTVGLNLK